MSSISQIKILFLAVAAALACCCPAWGDGRTGLKTVCIDAGHGGQDPGCVSADKKVLEKNLTLSIARMLESEIKAGNPDVKVVMTRTTDKYVTLNDRADIANKAGADLFISIHINASTSKTPSGYSLHCLGQSRNKNRDLFSSNMEMVRRENSVILLEEDYSGKYQGFDPNDPESYIFFNLIQNAHLEQSLLFAEEADKALKAGPVKKSRGISQDPFLVLWRTAMPSVLVECGFMSNLSDLAAMKTEAGQKKIAHCLYEAFVSFKKQYDGSIGGPADDGGRRPDAAEEATAVPQQDADPDEASQAVLYGTQVLATGRKMDAADPFFKGYRPVAVWNGKLYKYIIGVSSRPEDAREESKKIQKKFNGSFLVKIVGDDTERFR